MVTSDPTYETDAYGFAPTRIVRVRHSRRGGRSRFFRVWMKPANPSFPPQERELIGAELIEAMVKFADQRNDPPAVVRLAAGGGPGGVCPQNGSHPTRPGGDSGEEIAPREGLPFLPRLVEARAAELEELKLLPSAHPAQTVGKEIVGQMVAGVTAMLESGELHLPLRGDPKALAQLLDDDAYAEAAAAAVTTRDHVIANPPFEQDEGTPHYTLEGREEDDSE